MLVTAVVTNVVPDPLTITVEAKMDKDYNATLNLTRTTPGLRNIWDRCAIAKDDQVRINLNYYPKRKEKIRIVMVTKLLPATKRHR